MRTRYGQRNTIKKIVNKFIHLNILREVFPRKSGIRRRNNMRIGTSVRTGASARGGVSARTGTSTRAGTSARTVASTRAGTSARTVASTRAGTSARSARIGAFARGGASSYAAASRGIRRTASKYTQLRKLNSFGLKAAAWGVLFFVVILIWQWFNPQLRVTAAEETVAALRVPHQAAGMLKAYAAKHGVPFAELFTLFCAENGFFPEKHTAYDLSGIENQYVTAFSEIKRLYNDSSLKPYNAMFTNLFNEMIYFPISISDGDESPIIYGDSWGIDRNYEGDSLHRGADILDRENIRGRISVVSMTDGTVQTAGWDDDMGYHVGIQTTGGTYYLYAHLDSIDTNITVGAGVRGGQDLGRMGDSSGRGESFPVHLHIGISPNAEFAGDNFWINPYPFLRYLEKPTLL